MRCPTRWCANLRSLLAQLPGAPERRAAGVAMATAPTRPTSGATSARLVRLGERERALQAMAYFYATGGPPAGTSGPRSWCATRASRAFLGDMPHGWVASDQIRSVLDLFAYEDEGERSLVLAAGVPMAWLRGRACRSAACAHRTGAGLGRAASTAAARSTFECRACAHSARRHRTARAVGEERARLDRRPRGRGRARCDRPDPLAGARSRRARVSFAIATATRSFATFAPAHRPARVMPARTHESREDERRPARGGQPSARERQSLLRGDRRRCDHDARSPRASTRLSRRTTSPTGALRDGNRSLLRTTTDKRVAHGRAGASPVQLLRQARAWNAARARKKGTEHFRRVPALVRDSLVGAIGLEPTTPTMSRWVLGFRKPTASPDLPMKTDLLRPQKSAEFRLIFSYFFHTEA